MRLQLIIIGIAAVIVALGAAFVAIYRSALPPPPAAEFNLATEKEAACGPKPAFEEFLAALDPYRQLPDAPSPEIQEIFQVVVSDWEICQASFNQPEE